MYVKIYINTIEMLIKSLNAYNILKVDMLKYMQSGMITFKRKNEPLISRILYMENRCDLLTP